MSSYEVIIISKDLVYSNQDTEQQSTEGIHAQTGQIVSVLHLFTRTLTLDFATIEFGENHAVIRYGASENAVISGDLFTQEDEVRFELRGRNSEYISLIQSSEVREGFFVRLARE